MFEDGIKRLRCCHLQAPDLFQEFSVHVFETATEKATFANNFIVNSTIFSNYKCITIY